MSDIALLTESNNLGLSQEAIERLQRQLKSGITAPLSPERESGPFMLWCCQDSLEIISIKCNIPIDVIYATAIKYDWVAKAGVLHGDVKSIQKSIATSLLVATFMTIQKDLADVLAGRKSADKCKLMPQNIVGLERLMAMVSDVMGDAQLGKEVPGSTVVHAMNVQINNQLPEAPTKPRESAEEINAKFELLRGKK